MKDIFDAPPEDAMPTATDRALSIEYKNTKGISADFAENVNAEWIKEKFGEGRFGFKYYDKEAKQSVPVPQFTFIVLEVYAGVSGYNPEKEERFWSNRAKDTRIEPLIVSSNLSDRPIANGLYQSIKASLPKGAKYQKFVKAYCLELDKVVEIKLSAMAEHGMQKAIAAADKSAGRGTDWDKVFILGLADNDHLWGFHLTGHATTDIKGNEYKGDGDLFFEPAFKAGVLNPTKSADLHAKCVELQAQERKTHEQYQQRNAQQQIQPQEVQYTTDPIDTNIRRSNAADVTDDYFPEKAPAETTPPDTDDLPF